MQCQLLFVYENVLKFRARVFCKFNLNIKYAFMVAFGDRKDVLDVLRVLHFRRKCSTRKTSKTSFRSPKATMKAIFYIQIELTENSIPKL